MSKLKKIILASLLLATYIVLNRFISIKTELLVISFSFIPIMMSAIWLGPKYSTAIAAHGDLLSALIFPFGPYFPGFTVSNALTGLIYGLFLYNHGEKLPTKKLLIMLILSSCINFVAIRLLLTSLWINILYGKAFFVVLASRVIAELIMVPIQVVAIFGLEKFSRPYIQKYL